MESIIIIISALLAYFVIKPLLLNDLNTEKARKMINEGAVVIDVRSEDEHKTSHVKATDNIPLEEISNKISSHVSDTNKTILLYCRTGSRSFVAKRILKKMNYDNVYNLGSFKRAKRIMNNE